MNGIVFTTRPAVVYQLVKQVIDAVVGTDKAHLGPPHGQRHGSLEHLGQPIMEGGFVDSHIALHPPQVGGVAGERLHLEARGEIDHEGEDRLVLVVGEHRLLDLTGRLVVGLGPHGHGVDKLAGHLLVAAHIEVVAAAGSLGFGGRQSCISRLRPGNTGAAALLGDLERAFVGNPDSLVGQQHLVGGVFGTECLGQLLDDRGLSNGGHQAIPSISRRRAAAASPLRPAWITMAEVRSATSSAKAWRISFSRLWLCMAVDSSR
ncbi:hypothetical protein D3C75_790420 [compost metagenome]